MSRHEIEQKLEDRCVAKVEALGGEALKLVIPGVRGFLDRSIFLPRCKLFFCEFKRLRTGRISAQQHKWAGRMRQLGFSVYFCDNDADFDAALEKELNR